MKITPVLDDLFGSTYSPLVDSIWMDLASLRTLMLSSVGQDQCRQDVSYVPPPLPFPGIAYLVRPHIPELNTENP